jgi:carbon starvation protein
MRREGRAVLWTVIAALGAAGWAMLALHRGETINAAWLALAAEFGYQVASTAMEAA